MLPKNKNRNLVQNARQQGDHTATSNSSVSVSGVYIGMKNTEVLGEIRDLYCLSQIHQKWLNTL